MELLSGDVGQDSLEDPTRLQLSLEDLSLLREDLSLLQPLAVGAPLSVDQILLKQVFVVIVGLWKRFHIFIQFKMV